MWLNLLLACAPADDDTSEARGADTGAALDCPTFVDGSNEVFSAELRRRVVVMLPDEGAGPAPLVFFWHGRRQRAEDMVEKGDLRRLADELGVIAVAPDSADRDGYAWIDEPDSRDVQLFDDVRRCLIAEHGADPDRVHSAGFSAGGLFTTWLVMTRSPALASAISFSGGLDGTIMEYQTPEVRLPVMVVWGGPGDTSTVGTFTVDFEQTSTYFADQLKADDHVVVVCEHDNGHRIPGAAPLMLTEWSLVHERGEPSPRAADLGSLPDYCRIL